MAFLTDGKLLISERNTDQLYILNTDNTLSKPLESVPEVWTLAQGGLMDIILHPEYKENNYVYLSYAKPNQGWKAATALGRGKIADSRIACL